MEKTMVRLRKWGNSFGVIIPSEIVSNKNLREGAELEITLESKDRMTVGEVLRLAKKIRLKKVNVQKALDELDDEFEGDDE